MAHLVLASGNYDTGLYLVTLSDPSQGDLHTNVTTIKAHKNVSSISFNPTSGHLIVNVTSYVTVRTFDTNV